MKTQYLYYTFHLILQDISKCLKAVVVLTEHYLLFSLIVEQLPKKVLIFCPF